MAKTNKLPNAYQMGTTMITIQKPKKSAFSKDMPIVSKTTTKSKKPKSKKPVKIDYLKGFEHKTLPSFKIKKLVEFQRKNSPLQSMRQCHTKPIYCFNPSDKTENITLRINEHGYRASGLNRCKNPYCPLCSKAKAGERFHRLRDGLTGARAKKYPIYFVSLTIPRDKSIEKQIQELRIRWKGLQNSFTYLKNKKGIEVFTSKALDVTFNPRFNNHRYHLHIHAIVILSEEIGDDLFDQIVRKKWLKFNHSTCSASKKYGVDVQRVLNTPDDRDRVGRYVSKMAGLAMEITSQTTKYTKSINSITLVELMLNEKSDGTKLNPAKCQLIYQEFLDGMYRTNTLNISRNWNSLMVQDDEPDEDFEEIEIQIHVENWHHIRHYWFMIAEKIQHEIFLVPESIKKRPFRYQKIIGMATAFLNSQPDNEQVNSFCRMKL
jgi:hypothetical protein